MKTHNSSFTSNSDLLHRYITLMRVSLFEHSILSPGSLPDRYIGEVGESQKIRVEVVQLEDTSQ